jgi:hypothetical protein
MDITINVLSILEEYGRCKAEILNVYGLDSGEGVGLSGEIEKRLYLWK